MNNTDESYYKALNVVDRIEEIKKRKKIRNSHFSVLMGRSYAYWTVVYTSARCIRLRTLDMIARFLDINLEYLLYGKNPGKYNQGCDIKKIPEYTKGKKIYLTESQRSIISKIRNGKQKDISLNLFFQIEEKIKENLYNIIKNS